MFLKVRKLILSIFFIIATTSVFAQDVQDQVRTIVEDYVSQNEDANVDVELIYEILFDLYENPININGASNEDLSQLPFLSTHQINALQEYKKRHGDLVSIYELQAVYAFDRKTIENIVPFISLSPVENDYKRRMYFKHEILTRSNFVVEDQLGYTRPDSLTHYNGGPYSALVKYKGSMGKQFSWHVTGEQDRGEAWFDHAKLTDFFSAGAQYTSDGIVENAIIGDYRMCFGQGLVMNNNFGYGKSAQVMDVLQKGKELRRFTSSTEYALFRGAATHLNYKNIDLIIGASSRKADASLDSVGNEVYIRSFTETGFHRTDSEVEKYKAARISDLTTHLGYTINNLKLGATFTTQQLSNTFQKADNIYNYYSPTYKQYYNASADYKWNVRGMMIFGEVATDKQHGLAVIQGVTIHPSSRVGMSMVYRNYSKDYYAMYGQAFGEGSSVNNEEGLYMGTNLLLSRNWTLDCYFDWYRFPWLRYGVSRPTTGYDILLQPTYSPSRTTKMHWRIKYEEKEDNVSTDLPTNEVENTESLNLRYHISSKLTDNISIQSRIATSHILHLENESGYLIYQDITAKMLQKKLSMTLRYALYNTSSYESRIYTYESDVLYLSSIPSYYGKGSRTYLNTSYKMNRTFTFYFKAAYNKSYDGRTMGSSLDAIDADHKTDIHLQVRIKL